MVKCARLCLAAAEEDDNDDDDEKKVLVEWMLNLLMVYQKMYIDYFHLH